MPCLDAAREDLLIRRADLLIRKAISEWGRQRLQRVLRRLARCCSTRCSRRRGLPLGRGTGWGRGS